jgi:hypothetical protein
VKKSFYSYIVAVFLAFCCFAGIAAAQPGIEGDTSISYDDETGMVTVYGETINGLDTDYASQMSVVVKDQNGTTVASGNDYQLWDNAAVALEFQGNPGSVYTATSNHCVRMQSWSYDNEFPYHQFYYDYWYMSSFLGQNILSPWYYWFASPGWQEVHRNTNVICTGKTYDTITIGPKVTINVPATAKDGDTVTFSASTQGGTPTAYQWTYSIDSGATGNNPQVNFSAPTAASTTADAHWYARPNSDCPSTPPALSASHPYYNSKYKIKVTVTFQGGSQKSKEANFAVNSWWAPAGQVDPNVARVTGIPTRSPDSSGVWRVTGMGSLGRLTPTKQVFVPATSQFYAKTVAHEGEHESHWAVGKLLGHLHNPSDFYTRIQNFTGTSDQNLIDKLSAELTAYTNEQGVLYTQLRAESERLAYSISDPISPQFAYQNCGQYP